MNDANVAVYPVDARGLMNAMSVADASVSQQPNGLRSYNRPWLLQATQSSLREFAEMTGGRAFYNRNDLSTGIELANYDSGHYYMLGYYLENKEERPGWRTLKVKVRRENAQARHRNGFFVTKSTEDPELTRKIDVLAALQSPFDSTGLPILGNVIGATAGADGKKQIEFGITVPGTALLVDTTAKNRLALEIVGVARTPAGVDADRFLQRVESNLPDEKVASLRADGLHYTNTLQLLPGRYDVRLLVRDNATGRLGTASVSISVK
jgi:hypothetical protein